MKILFVTPYLCYPDVPYAGGMTIFKLMERLSSRGHDVHLITGLRPGDKGHLEEVKAFCNVLDAIEVPWTKAEIAKAVAGWALGGFKGGLKFRKRIAMSVNRFSKEIGFDIIMVEHTEIGEFMEKPIPTPFLIDAHDIILKPVMREYMLAGGLSRIIKYLRYKAVERKELSIYKKFDRIYTRSEHDRKLLLGYDKGLDVSVLPPYVRTENFGSSDAGREPYTLLFVGAMDRHVNIYAVQFFCEKIFPLIRDKIPDTKFFVVGNKPPEEIWALGQKDKNIVVTGYVDDVMPFYLRASVFVAPLFIGGGIIVKILDAMAAGLPVVTTSVGNEGIEAVPDRDFIMEDEPGGFADKVIMLLRDNDLWQSLSSNGKSFVHKKFSWDKIVRNMESEYKSLMP